MLSSHWPLLCHVLQASCRLRVRFRTNDDDDIRGRVLGARAVLLALKEAPWVPTRLDDDLIRLRLAMATDLASRNSL